QDKMIDQLKQERMVSVGDKVVITHGDGKFFKQGSSNSLRVEIIKDLSRDPNKTSHQDALIEEGTRLGKILLDSSLCASCQRCIQICPHDIFITSGDKNRDTILNSKTAMNCANDLQCIDACPTG